MIPSVSATDFDISRADFDTRAARRTTKKTGVALNRLLSFDHIALLNFTDIF